MSKEVKVGILAIIAIAVSIWGYKFLKGQDLFSSNKSFHTTFSDVTKLPNSATVFLNGFKVGQVTSIKLNPTDVKMMDVHFNISGDIPLPKDATVVMKNDGFIGDKLLSLEFDRPCSGPDCAESGDFIEGKSIGLIGSMIGANEASSYVSEMSGEVQQLIASLGAEGSEGRLNDIIRNLDGTIAQLAELSKSTTNLINSSNRSLSNTLKNLDAITRNLADNNDKVSSLLSNVNKVTEDLSKAELGNTITKANSMIDKTTSTLEGLDGTITSLDATVKNLNSITEKMNSGDGSLGQLMNDKKLYDNITETSKNISLLLQDLRLNPKRYVNISVFGKKNKEYILPEDDPAYQKNK